MAAALGGNHAGLAIWVRVDLTIVSFGRPRGVTSTVVCFFMVFRGGRPQTQPPVGVRPCYGFTIIPTGQWSLPMTSCEIYAFFSDGLRLEVIQ